LRLQPPLEGYDIVISVRTEAATAGYGALEQELTLLLRRARLLAVPASSPEA
jgi:RNase P protein component